MPCCDDKLYVYKTKLIKVAIETCSMERGLGQENKYVLKDRMIYLGLTDIKNRKVI